MRWNAETDTKQYIVSKKKQRESSIYKSPEDVFKNLIQAYIAVTDNMFTEEPRVHHLTGREII